MEAVNHWCQLNVSLAVKTAATQPKPAYAGLRNFDFPLVRAGGLGFYSRDFQSPGLKLTPMHSCAPLLCEWLGYLPLGLELVGRYLAEDPDLSLAEMLERLKAQRLQDEAIDLDEQQMQNTFSTAQRGVRAAFELSWQELEPVTQRVAQLLSLFAPTVFLWGWVEDRRG